MTEAGATATGPSWQEALATWLAGAAGARTVAIETIEKLAGGAIQENWRLAVRVSGGDHAGQQHWVLRTDAPSSVATSLSRPQEFDLLRAAAAAGVTVPEPLFLCDTESVLGRLFYVMRYVPGVAEGHRLVRDPAIASAGDDLVGQLGRELARIHSIVPPREDLGFLPVPELPPALARIATYRRYLDDLSEPSPALERALRWLELNAPRAAHLVLCHSDFRTGNYKVENGRVTGILDWEFAAWSDPNEDIAWFCYRYWRFGADDREAGGIGSREAFYRAYESEAARPVAREHIAYWEIMAAVRWGVIALQQGERHLSGAEPSLELALTGLQVPEMEMDALSGIARIEAEAGA